jgi:hypothetical protein
VGPELRALVVAADEEPRHAIVRRLVGGPTLDPPGELSLARARVERVVVVSVAARGPAAEPEVVAQRPPLFRKRDLQAGAAIRVAVVLVGAAADQLEEVPFGVGPLLGSGGVEVAAEDEVHPLGQEPPHLAAIGQLVEAVVEERQAEARERAPLADARRIAYEEFAEGGAGSLRDPGRRGGVGSVV